MKNNGNRYLQNYPRLWKWINKCVGCQTIGYKPELPANITRKGGMVTGAAQNLRRFFNELRINEDGFCDQCEIMNKDP